jgi:hypothetical protein
MKKDSSLAWERRGRNQEMNVIFIDINHMKEFFPSVDQKVQDTWGEAAKAIKVDKKIFQGIAPLHHNANRSRSLICFYSG